MRGSDCSHVTFSETGIKGAFIVDVEKIEDARGFFAQAWYRRGFKEHRLEEHFLQYNIFYNKKREL